jgi:hypothetical protein
MAAPTAGVCNRCSYLVMYYIKAPQPFICSDAKSKLSFHKDVVQYSAAQVTFHSTVTVHVHTVVQLHVHDKNTSEP